MRPRFVALFVALAVLTAGAQSAVGADSSRSGEGKSRAAAAKIPSIKNLKYKPTPSIEAIPAIPDPAEVPKPDPTGNYNAYDINVYETFWFPERQPGDESAEDEPGGAITHGTCPQGGCANHELEFQNYWMKRMKKLVKPFGGRVSRYGFFSQGAGLPDGAPLAQPEGDTANLMATIPGAKHPDQSVIVSGHYDQTDSGPASAWDSAEGHATVFRIAKLMIDYWKRTGNAAPGKCEVRLVGGRGVRFVRIAGLRARQPLPVPEPPSAGLLQPRPLRRRISRRTSEATRPSASRWSCNCPIRTRRSHRP